MQCRGYEPTKSIMFVANRCEKKKGCDIIRYFYDDYAKHMWRYYCMNRFITADMMNDVDLHNWSACNTVFSDMPQSEQDILCAFGTCKRGMEEKTIAEYAARNKISRIDAWAVIHKAFKMAAIERGLIDRRGKNGKE